MVNEGMPLDSDKMVDEDMPLYSEKMGDEGMPLDTEKMVDVAMPLDFEKMVDVAMPLESEKKVDEGMPLYSENEKNKSGRDASVDEGMPLYQNIFDGTMKKKIRKRLDDIFSLLRNSPKLKLVILITTMTMTSTYAFESDSSRILTFPTPVILNQPFCITAYLKNTTCGDHLHWLQVSDQFDVNIIARGTLSYNESVYNIFLDSSDEMCLNYTLQINKVTFEDLKKEYRVECGSKTIPIKVLEDHEVILQPEILQKTFFIENNTLIGTVILAYMYPKPTSYRITLQTSDGRNMTFDRPFLNGSDNNVPNLMNKTLNVREKIEKNICSGIVSVTIFVGDRVIDSFSYQIFSNCSTGMNNEVHISPTLIIIITVVSVLGAVIVVLGCMFKHKLKPCIKQIRKSFLATGIHSNSAEDIRNESQERESFLYL